VYSSNIRRKISRSLERFLDWETINKLCEQNGDFAKFVEDVKIDSESKQIHKSEYDEISKDPEKDIVEKLGVEQPG
jgi:hypothetical protein